jgi:hypothetical protein
MLSLKKHSYLTLIFLILILNNSSFFLHGSTSRTALSNSASALFCFRGSKIWFKSISIVQYVQHGTGLLNPSTTPLHCSAVPKVTPLFHVSCWAHAISTAHWGPRDLCHPLLFHVFDLYSYFPLNVSQFSSTAAAVLQQPLRAGTTHVLSVSSNGYWTMYVLGFFFVFVHPCCYWDVLSFWSCTVYFY